LKNKDLNQKRIYIKQIVFVDLEAYTKLLKTYTTRKQSEPADLRQGHVVRQVAAPYSVWQRLPLCPIESNVNENFKVIQNPGFLPDHPQN